MSSTRRLRSSVSNTRLNALNRRQPSRQNNNEIGACIDLTVDIGGDEVIDLTHHSNIMDSPVVIISPSDDVGPVRRRRGSGRRGLRRHNSQSRLLTSVLNGISLSHDPMPSSSNAGQIELENSDDELPDIPFEIPEASSKINAVYCKSPPVQITCPICLDDVKQIKTNKKRIMSTICGHIFCEECIKGAIKTYRSCPTCRKPLAANKIHPLFL